MDNHNTFNPSVDASTFGPTSDYNGYGTDENGYDVEKNDLGPDYYNKQAHMGAEALYAATEAEDIAKEEADEAAWNAEGEEKERNDKIHLALTGARDAIKEANARLDAIEAIIKEGEERAKHIGIEELSNEESKDTTASVPSVDSTEIKNIATAPPSAHENNIVTETPEKSATKDVYYLGKDGIRYSKREDAIASSNEESKDMTASAPFVDNAELENIAAAPPSAHENNIVTEAPEKSATKDVYYLGKDGIRYSKREDAIASFQD